MTRETGKSVGIVVLALVCALLTVVLAYEHQQRTAWADRWQAQSDQFARHVACMQRPGCDSMSFRPQAR